MSNERESSALWCRPTELAVGERLTWRAARSAEAVFVLRGTVRSVGAECLAETLLVEGGATAELVAEEGTFVTIFGDS